MNVWQRLRKALQHARATNLAYKLIDKLDLDEPEDLELLRAIHAWSEVKLSQIPPDRLAAINAILKNHN